ncbi:MAG: ATP-binding protein [Actinomycetota bacterium]
MTFRSRLMLVAAVAVAAAVATASAVMWLLVRDELRDQVDRSLREVAANVVFTVGADGVLFRLPAPELGGARGFAELVHSSRRAAVEPNLIPDRAIDLEIAAGRAGPAFRDDSIGSRRVRVLTIPAPQGTAVQLVRPLNEVDATLAAMGVVLGLVSGAGVLGAAVLGWAVSRAALRPVRELTEATEHIAATQDLARRIREGGEDELGRLGASFNTMLEALDRSVRSQRQLVADASHELRTPLTSLRTNIELLAGGKRFPSGERRRMLDDVVDQLEELSTLVSDVVELARDGELPADAEQVALDRLVADVVERVAGRTERVRFETDLRPSMVHGVPARLDRAVTNLLDNAIKWSPQGGVVEVGVAGGEVRVRDHGPGIDDPDLPHVFDRFYRAPSARGVPGSGLGLAIVRQIAEAHGGSAEADRAPGGGAALRLRLPPTPGS